jgi:hypothetical protein
MKEDAVIERIRNVREEITKDCDYDAKKLVAHYRQRQEEKDNNQCRLEKEALENR